MAARDKSDPPTRAKTVLVLIAFLLVLIPYVSIGVAQESKPINNPRGLDPWRDATYMPELGGVIKRTLRNQYGQKRDLAECVVLRRSHIKDGKAYVAAGGLYYASDTSHDARPFMRDPFLILGEHTYLLRLKTEKIVKRHIKVKVKDKALVDPSGYRIWYDFATDHYEKPYGEFAFIAPSGGWPHEWPISTSFPGPPKVREIDLKSGIHPQLRDFYMTDSYIYGATKLIAENVTEKEAVFTVEYPHIKEAIFSFDRPYVVNIKQETFRWYGTKRIYASWKENGILVEVRNWTGKKLLASKVLKPPTQQEYKVADQDDLCLTDLDLDIHIELIVDPSWYKGSDFAPWANDVPYGWTEGTVSFAIYDDLIKLEDGKPWPRDKRYIVRLEPNLETGMLKRLVLENKDPFVLSNENPKYDGPVKISEFWDRNYFTVVAKDFEKDVVHNSYVRDSFFRRTDNLVLWKDGRENVDFFIGMSPLVVSVMEDTFLMRLADPSYGVPVVKSRFTSFPKFIPNAKWFAPDPTAAFVPKMKGFVRKYVRNRKGKRLVASEVLVIRRSYVDYRKGKIIIPPGGLYYSTRNSRNIRPGEPLYFMGKKAYLLRFKSYLVVKRDFRIDLWKEMPMGDRNLIFWQDVPLGDGSKAMRYTGSRIVWGRPVAELRITKYSGNNWGANILVAPGFKSYVDLERSELKEGSRPQDFEYFLPSEFAEGATYLIPKWVSPDFVEIEEMGTPGMDSFTITLKQPRGAIMGEGDERKLGKYKVLLKEIDRDKKQVTLTLKDLSGKVVAEKTLGPFDQDLYDTLPQYAPSQQKIMMHYDDIQIDVDVPVDLERGKIRLWLATDAETFDRDKPYPGDPRFMVRPDVCGHCYQLNEIILDNKDPIVLDGKNNVFTGLNGYFKIVVDDFDGEAINAWHIEDRFGRKTPNLAEYPRDNLDVMVGVNGTTESFLRKTLLDRLAYREIWRLK